MLSNCDFVFTPVTVDDQKLFQHVTSSCRLYADSPATETTFQMIYCWGVADEPQKCSVDEGIIVCFKEEFGHRNVFYPPLVKEEKNFVPALKKIKLCAERMGFEFFVVRLTDEMVRLVTDSGEDLGVIAEERSAFKYLHNPSDLINLPGKNYKSKRNLVQTFKSDFDYELLPYDDSMKQTLLKLVWQWGRDVESEDFKGEYGALQRALDNFDAFNMICDVIKINGEIEAFEAGFITPSNVGAVMFEKANTDYRGCYQAMSNFFVEKNFSRCRYVNRQEDLGIAGLRDAKMSYHPVAFSKKYTLSSKK